MRFLQAEKVSPTCSRFQGSIRLDGLRLIWNVSVFLFFELLLFFLVHEKALHALAVRRSFWAGQVLLTGQSFSPWQNVNFEAHTGHILEASGSLLSLNKNSSSLLVKNGKGYFTTLAGNNNLARERVVNGLHEKWLLNRDESGSLVWEERGLIVGRQLCNIPFKNVGVHCFFRTSKIFINKLITSFCFQLNNTDGVLGFWGYCNTTC